MNHEFLLKELIHFKQQARQEVRELHKPNLDWRMKSLAQNNLEQANRMILDLLERLKKFKVI